MPRSRNAMKAALMVADGQPLFVWRSGAGGGLFARAEAAGKAVPAFNPPWPNGTQYSYTFKIRVTDELSVPVGDSFPGNKTSPVFGLQNIWLTWGFWHLPPDVVDRMNAAFRR